VEHFWQVSLTTFMPIIDIMTNKGNKRCQNFLIWFQIALKCQNNMKFVTRSVRDT
jgi:hypothetical protein